MVLVQQVALDTIFCIVIPVYGLGYLDIQKQVIPHLLWFFEYLYNCTHQKHCFPCPIYSSKDDMPCSLVIQDFRMSIWNRKMRDKEEIKTYLALNYIFGLSNFIHE